MRSSCPKAYTITTIVSFDPSSLSTLPYLQTAAIDPAVCVLPLLLHRVPAGFPSPADEYVEKGLDLNTYLVRNKVATYFFRVVGDSMTGAHIHDGDMLVDRSIEPKHGHIVLAVINNEYTVKRLYVCDGVVELHAENPCLSPHPFQGARRIAGMGRRGGHCRSLCCVIMSTENTPVSQPMFALVDVNHFYLSCERVFNPGLINRPR